jgi:hypothetical protein
MILRNKLRNRTILMRRAVLGGSESWKILYISMINDATIEENKLFYWIIVRTDDMSANQQRESRLTRKTIELVLPITVSTKFLSLISASDLYSFQYADDVSPYLGAIPVVGALFTRVKDRNFFSFSMRTMEIGILFINSIMDLRLYVGVCLHCG